MAPDGQERRRGSPVEVAKVSARADHKQHIVLALPLYEHDILMHEANRTVLPRVVRNLCDNENAGGDDEMRGSGVHRFKLFVARTFSPGALCGVVYQQRDHILPGERPAYRSSQRMLPTERIRQTFGSSRALCMYS